jgi:hypothetical protein
MKPSRVAPAKKKEDAKTAILRYLDHRLREWAAWSKQGARLGLGYPSCSLEYRLLTEGHVARECLGLKPTPTHSAAEEIEVYITEMSVQHFKMAEVLKYYYLHVGGIYDHARQLGMSHAHFEMHLNIGRWWLAGRLSEKVPIKNFMREVRCELESRHEKIKK